MSGVPLQGYKTREVHRRDICSAHLYDKSMFVCANIRGCLRHFKKVLLDIRFFMKMYSRKMFAVLVKTVITATFAGLSMARDMHREHV